MTPKRDTQDSSICVRASLLGNPHVGQCRFRPSGILFFHMLAGVNTRLLHLGHLTDTLIQMVAATRINVMTAIVCTKKSNRDGSTTKLNRPICPIRPATRNTP